MPVHSSLSFDACVEHFRQYYKQVFCSGSKKKFRPDNYFVIDLKSKDNCESRVDSCGGYWFLVVLLDVITTGFIGRIKDKKQKQKNQSKLSFPQWDVFTVTIHEMMVKYNIAESSTICVDFSQCNVRSIRSIWTMLTANIKKEENIRVMKQRRFITSFAKKMIEMATDNFDIESLTRDQSEIEQMETCMLIMEDCSFPSSFEEIVNRAVNNAVNAYSKMSDEDVSKLKEKLNPSNKTTSCSKKRKAESVMQIESSCNDCDDHSESDCGSVAASNSDVSNQDWCDLEELLCGWSEDDTTDEDEASILSTPSTPVHNATCQWVGVDKTDEAKPSLCSTPSSPFHDFSLSESLDIFEPATKKIRSHLDHERELFDLCDFKCC